mmetsp:Transcript_3960/g.10155  ORF Transcript_3960/g.10155 Transcript_3960/m.10155 type:complete len:287 (+) Transcript_3960:68-928(+)
MASTPHAAGTLAAIALGAACVALSSGAFVAGAGQARTLGATPLRHFLGHAVGAGDDAPSSETAWGTSALGAGLAVGIVIGAASAAARAKVLRRWEPFQGYYMLKQEGVELPTEFAGGLEGSEYAGFGEYKFDPMRLTELYPEHLPWFREAELKHGRVCMLACVGLVAPDGFRIPMDVFESSALDPFTSHSKLIGPGFGEGPMWWLAIFCAVIESLRFKQLGLAFEKLTLESAGDLGFGKGFLPKTKEGILLMKIKELKNGRLAMLAFSGAITQGVLFNVHHFPFAP